MIIAFLCALVLAFYGLMTNRTVLGFSIKDGQLSGLFFLTNLILFIIPCIIIIQYVDVYNSPVLFYVSEDSLFEANILIIYGIFSFLAFFGIFYRIFINSFEYSRGKLEKELHHHRDSLFFVFYVCIALLIISVAFAIFGLGARHAFFEGFLGYGSAGVIRHQNAAISNLSYFKHFISLNCALVSAIIATRAFDQRGWVRLIGILVIIVCGSFYGSKSPIAIYSIIFALAYMESHGEIKSITFIKKIAFLLIICLLVLYGAIYFTYISNNENFNFGQYLFNRVFIAQMAGMYEQWNLDLRSTVYAYHFVPFASLFIDYPVFHKDLMMISENRIDVNSIGIKNTFYLAEAYAAFGNLGLIFAPIIMGFSMVVNYLILSKFFQRVFGNKRLGVFFGSYLFVFFFGLTDGISQSVLLKGSVVVILLFLPLFLFSSLRTISQSSTSNSLRMPLAAQR